MDRQQKHLQSLVQKELMDGETVLWSDQPNPVLFSAESYLVSLFSLNFIVLGGLLVILVFAYFNLMIEYGFSLVIVFMIAACTAGAYMVFKFGIPLLFAPVIIKIQAKNHIIAVTNRKAFAVNDGLYKSVCHYFPSEIAEPERWIKNEKNGSILFSYFGSNTRKCNCGFRGLKDIQTVESFLKQLKSPHIHP